MCLQAFCFYFDIFSLNVLKTKLWFSMHAMMTELFLPVSITKERNKKQLFILHFKPVFISSLWFYTRNNALHMKPRHRQGICYITRHFLLILIENIFSIFAHKTAKFCQKKHSFIVRSILLINQADIATALNQQSPKKRRCQI